MNRFWFPLARSTATAPDPASIISPHSQTTTRAPSLIATLRRTISIIKALPASQTFPTIATIATAAALLAALPTPAHADVVERMVKKVMADPSSGEAGAVVLGDPSAVACDATTEGAVKYVDASNRVELCDDGAWIAVGGGGSLGIDGLSDAVKNSTDYNLVLGSEMTTIPAGATGNLFIGQRAGAVPSSNAADANIAIGDQALDALTTGWGNIAIGYQALTTNTSGEANTAVGYQALQLNTGNANTAVGRGALNQNTGLNNTAVGAGALEQNSTASENTALGVYALRANTTALRNTAVGYLALENSNGDDNTAVGYQTLMNNSSGTWNVAIGSWALTTATTAISNTAVGIGALNATTGSENVAVGTDALLDNTDGAGSVAVGVEALANVTTGGTQNIGIGYHAGDNLTTGDQNIIIGYDVDAPSATANSQLSIGNLIFATGGFGTGTTLGTGNVGIGVNNPGGKLTIGNGATAGGELRIMEDSDTGTNYASFTVPTLAANTVYTLPPDDGDAGEQLQTNGSGVLTWEAAGSGGSLGIDGLTDAYTVYDAGTTSNFIMGRAAAAALTAGAAQNLFIGENAGATTANSTATTDGNVGVGYNSLANLTSGANNLAFGGWSLYGVTVGSDNVGVGGGAGITTGIRNVAVGTYSLNANNGGGGNVAIGWGAMYTSSTGDQNIAIGQGALSGTTGSNNVAVGGAALDANTDGNGSTAIGYDALGAVTTGGTQNIALGFQAGNNITTGDNNIIIGYDVDAPSATANSQLSIGNLIFATGGFGTGTTVGAGNVGIGVNNPGGKLTIGNGATSGGELRIMEDTDAGTNYASFTVPTLAANTVYTLPPDDGDAGEQLQTNGSGVLTWEAAGSGGGGSIDGLSDGITDYSVGFNLSMGQSAGDSMVAGATNNLFIGQNAGTSLTDGDGNTGVGYQALDSVTTGQYNTAFGEGALATITTTNGSSAFGAGALGASTGYSNTAVGDGALQANTSGSENTAVGQAALVSNLTGLRLVAVGTEALMSNTGSDNVAVGYRSLRTAGGANSNVGVGVNALLAVNTGSGNIGIGHNAGDNISSGGTNIIIGYDIDAPSATANSQLSIGNLIFATGGFGTGTTVGAGVIGIAQPAPNQGKLEVKGGSVCVDTNSDDNASSCIANESDMRLKRNIEDLTRGLDTLMQLRPVAFEWRYDDPEVLKHYDLIARFADQPKSIGLIAQDVQKLVPEAIEQETVGDAEEQYLQLDYDKLLPVVIKAVQEQQSLIHDLKAENDDLRARLDALEAAR